MQWEQLTAPDFARAVRETGVCVIDFGVLERHGDHLPLGTDCLNGHRLACLAAEKEAAVVFPLFYFGQIYEARCFPGTVALKPALLLEFVTNILDEAGRNGFRKIILLSAHHAMVPSGIPMEPRISANGRQPMAIAVSPYWTPMYLASRSILRRSRSSLRRSPHAKQFK